MRTGWRAALLIGCVASAVALFLQNVLRDTWQIRTLPERVMEWLLLFVPLDLFERGVQQLGGDAKEAALAGTVVGMAVVMVAIGALMLHAGWSSWRLLGASLVLWFLAMGGVMPVTGAGFFAHRLLISPILTSAGYLLVFLGYGCVLIGGRLLLLSRRGFAQRPRRLTRQGATKLTAQGTAGLTEHGATKPAEPETRKWTAEGATRHTEPGATRHTEPDATSPAEPGASRQTAQAGPRMTPQRAPRIAAQRTQRLTAQRATLMAERRALLVGLIGTVLAGGLARFVGREGGLVASTLPLASVPTRPLPPVATRSSSTPPLTAPTSTSSGVSVVGAPKPTAAPAPIAAAPAPTATPILEPLPNPPLPRRVARDKDGALTAAGRPKGELAPTITSNEDFYVVTKNAVADPLVDVASWRIFIDGEVNRPVQLDYRTLRALPAVEVTKTLECISNFTAGCNLTSFGCDLISTARWKGVRLSDVLDLAGGLKPSASGLAFLAIDEFSAGLPADVADDPETLIVYEMNGEPLPREHGFPARLLVPGRYGMKDPKWLAGIRAMNSEYQGWYEQRNWNKDGIIKTMSRIDLPTDGARLPAGEQRVAGIAYAGDRGLSKVEFSIDDGGSWQSATLLESMPGKDAMVRWEGMFVVPASGSVTITMRATDGQGDAQTEEFQLPQPDGASGRDSITVTAA